MIINKEKDVIEISIFFNDLNGKAKTELLNAVDADDPEKMNWDADIFPIAMFHISIESDEYSAMEVD